MMENSGAVAVRFRLFGKQTIWRSRKCALIKAAMFENGSSPCNWLAAPLKRFTGSTCKSVGLSGCLD